ncbi:hypothetical protein BDF19DRAFT_395149 [Syncephalis fuscata]|nr:hypothetical protein BDF19DRAFT_395149 [Syncephalis fuscata]
MQPSLTLYANAVNTFKRAQRGLFDGKHIQFGNNKPFSLKKTRRTWLPNVQNKRLYSDILGRMVRFRVTAAALRTIDKKGGLDNYLLKTRDDKLASEAGVRLKRVLEEKVAARRNLNLKSNEKPMPKLTKRLEKAEAV